MRDEMLLLDDGERQKVFDEWFADDEQVRCYGPLAPDGTRYSHFFGIDCYLHKLQTGELRLISPDEAEQYMRQQARRMTA